MLQKSSGGISQRSLSIAREILKVNKTPSVEPFEILTKKQLAASKSFIHNRLNVNQRERLGVEKRKAAVLVPVANVNGEISVIFTKRSENLSSHRGHISFPGGHIEKNETFIEAAVREFKEELGGEYDYEDSLEILGWTQTIPAITGVPVTPVVAALTNDIGSLSDSFDPDPAEVDFVFSRSITELLDYESEEKLLRMHSAPMYECPEGKIWGLTSIILHPILHKVIVPAFKESQYQFKSSNL